MKQKLSNKSCKNVDAYVALLHILSIAQETISRDLDIVLILA